MIETTTTDTRVTALTRLPDGRIVTHRAMALWVALLPDARGEFTRIVGGRSDNSPTRDRRVSLVKAYV